MNDDYDEFDREIDRYLAIIFIATFIIGIGRSL